MVEDQTKIGLSWGKVKTAGLILAGAVGSGGLDVLLQKYVGTTWATWILEGIGILKEAVAESSG